MAPESMTTEQITDPAAGIGAVIGGACLALTLYGLVVMVASLFHVELIPHSSLGLGITMVGFLVGGAVVGGAGGALRRRRR